MRPTTTTLLLIGMLIVLYADESSAFWSRRRTKSSNCKGGKPYYFGVTDLFCGDKFKRAAPSRGTLRVTHSWIYFDGYYFERLVKQDVYGTSPTDSDKCSWSREDFVAGYSRLSVDCIKKCTEKYRGRYGGYNLITNNCHYFINRISEILCDYTSCPSWCN